MTAADRSRSPETRQRLIDAAVSCILELGFYRASSNAIADHAGLTWGVIQYHFGTRENLMLAVLEDAAGRLHRTLSGAQITPAPLEGRLEQLFEALDGYYGRPSFVAFTEVQLNLSHDPRTSERTHENLRRINEPVRRELDRLMGQVLEGVAPDGAADDPDIRSLIFHALRGISISAVMLGAQPWDSSRTPLVPPGQAALLARALALLIAERAGSA